jgi:hypothetical protein
MMATLIGDRLPTWPLSSTSRCLNNNTVETRGTRRFRRTWRNRLTRLCHACKISYYNDLSSWKETTFSAGKTWTPDSPDARLRGVDGLTHVISQLYTADRRRSRPPLYTPKRHRALIYTAAPKRLFMSLTSLICVMHFVLSSSVRSCPITPATQMARLASG